MLTRTETIFLFELLAKRTLTKKDFKFCKTNHFYRMIANLKKNNLIDQKENGGCNLYFLTEKGRIRIFVDGKDLNTPEKYKPFIKEILVIA